MFALPQFHCPKKATKASKKNRKNDKFINISQQKHNQTIFLFSKLQKIDVDSWHFGSSKCKNLLYFSSSKCKNLLQQSSEFAALWLQQMQQIFCTSAVANCAVNLLQFGCSELCSNFVALQLQNIRCSMVVIRLQISCISASNLLHFARDFGQN